MTKCGVEILRRPSLPARGGRLLFSFSLLVLLEVCPFYCCCLHGDCCQIRVLMNSLNLSFLPVQQKICFPWLHCRNCLLPFVHFDPFQFYWVSFLKFFFPSLESEMGHWDHISTHRNVFRVSHRGQRFREPCITVDTRLVAYICVQQAIVDD